MGSLPQVRRLIPLVASLLAACAVGLLPPASAASPGGMPGELPPRPPGSHSLALQLEVGLAGAVVPGRWTPVTVAVQNEAGPGEPPWQGEVVLEVRRTEVSGEQALTRYIQPVQVPAGARLPVRFHTILDGTLPVAALLVQGSAPSQVLGPPSGTPAGSRRALSTRVAFGATPVPSVSTPVASIEQPVRPLLVHQELIVVVRPSPSGYDFLLEEPASSPGAPGGTGVALITPGGGPAGGGPAPGRLPGAGSLAAGSLAQPSPGSPGSPVRYLESALQVPGQWPALEAVRTLVLTAPAGNQLSEAQAAAVWTWLDLGGELILVGGPEPPRLAGGLGRLLAVLPFRILPQTAVVEVGDLLRLLGVVAGSGREAGGRVALWRLEVPDAASPEPALARSVPVGAGFITVLAFDPYDPALAPYRQAVLDRVRELLGRRPAGPERAGLERARPEQAVAATARLAATGPRLSGTVPPADWEALHLAVGAAASQERVTLATRRALAGFAALYAVVVTGLLWLVLRTGRRWLVAAVALWVVAAAAWGVLAFVRPARTAGRLVGEVTLVQSPPAATAAPVQVTVFSHGLGDKPLLLPYTPAELASPWEVVPAAPADLPPGTGYLEARRAAEGWAIRSVGAPPGYQSRFAAQSVLALPPAAVEPAAAGPVSGTPAGEPSEELRNQWQRPIHQGWLLAAGGVVTLPRVEAGQALPLPAPLQAEEPLPPEALARAVAETLRTSTLAGERPLPARVIDQVLWTAAQTSRLAPALAAAAGPSSGRDAPLAPLWQWPLVVLWIEPPPWVQACGGCTRVTAGMQVLPASGGRAGAEPDAQGRRAR